MEYEADKTVYVRVLKPLADFVLAMVAIIVLSPVLILVYALLFITFRGNPLFVQQRTGLREKSFFIYKFKTMTNATDDWGNLLPDHARLTPVGRLIRKTSLDELPQLINILKGDMSFIGPRPLLPEYLPYYSSEQRRRHDVKPGISGLAQINGRNQTSWEKRLWLDVEYVRTISVGLDFRLLMKTIFKVVKTEGISPEGQPTMPKFSDYMKNKRE